MLFSSSSLFHWPFGHLLILPSASKYSAEQLSGAKLTRDRDEVVEEEDAGIDCDDAKLTRERDEVVEAEDAGIECDD